MELNSKNELNTTINPKVSIVIPVFNGSDYLNEAIDSALAQTYKNIEIIVVNDGSTDNGKTEKIALSYGDKIRYLRKENGGVATALNKGIKEMTGEYFSWLSHDDIYFPHKIETQVNVLSGIKNKEIFLFSDFEFIDEGGKHLNYFRVDEEFRNHFGLCVLFNQIHGCTVLVHRSILAGINGFDPAHLTTQDYWAWIEVFKTGIPTVHIKEVLVKSRLHKNQGTNVMSEISSMEINAIEKAFISDIAPHYPLFLDKIGQYYKFRNIALYKYFLETARKNEISFLNLMKINFLLLLLSFKKKMGKDENKNQSEALNKTYSENLWNDEHSRSGPGSNLENTAEIRVRIPELLKKFNIKTLIDAPCGDFYWMQLISTDLEKILEKYLGIDIVAELIETNNKRFASEKISFIKGDLTQDRLPQYDCVLCRDLFLHLPYRHIYNIITNIRKSGIKYLLISTYTKPRRNSNVPAFYLYGRALNLRRHPFYLPDPLAIINEKYTGQNFEYDDKSLMLLDTSSINLWRMNLMVSMNELFFISLSTASNISKRGYRKFKRIVSRLVK